MHRVGTVLLTGAAAMVLTSCSSGANSEPPDFQPSPTGPGIEGSAGIHLQPILPVPSLSGGDGAGSGQPGGSSAPRGPSQKPPKKDPLVVATHLTAPVGLTLLTDGSALVGERTTGRIVRVQPQPGKPVPTVRTLHGLDASGDGGLLDLAVSPTYDEDNLIYAYITTPTDNRVVDFTLDGPVTPVRTGIPKGSTGNTGRLAFAPDGNLYVGTGDAGKPALAADPKSLAGKVLRITDIGRPAAGNPTPTSPVYTRGQHVVDGLCAIPRTTSVLEVETGAAGHPDEVNVIAQGAYYGWPNPTSTAHTPAASLPAPYRIPGGCAVLANRIWISSLGGSALVSAPLTGGVDRVGVGTFTATLKNRYGRLRTVVAAQDGALWLTTSNRDGRGRPVTDDERVIRYVPTASDGGSGKAA